MGILKSEIIWTSPNLLGYINLFVKRQRPWKQISGLIDVTLLLLTLWKDPWYFHIPLAYKTTFINVYLESLSPADFMCENSLDFRELQHFLRHHLDWCRLPKVVIDNACTNHWVWHPICSSGNITNAVYNNLNQDNVLGDS